MAIPSWNDTTTTVEAPPAWDDTLSSGGDAPPAKPYPLNVAVNKPVHPISKTAYSEALTSYLSGNREMAIAKAKVAYAADNNNIEARNMIERIQRSPSAGTVAFGRQRTPSAPTPKPTWGDTFKDLGEVVKYAYTAVDTSAPVRTLGAGSARVMAQATRIPNLASNIFALPYNAAVQMAGRGDLAVKSPRSFEKEAKWWDEKANQLSEGVQRWGSKGETFTDVLKRKKSGEVARYIAYKVLEEAPQQAIVIGSTLAGMPTAALTYMGISSAAQAQSEGEGSGASPAAVTANAVINGTLEAALERTPALLGKWSKALESSFGKQGKMQILKNVAKTIGSSIIQEGPVEEGSTEFLQSLAAQATGVNPNAMSGVGNRMLEASVIGGAMGAGMTAPAAIGAGYYQNGQNVAPLDINQRPEYLTGYGTPPPGGGGPSGPSGPSSPVGPSVPVSGNTPNVVPPVGVQQVQPSVAIPTPPVQNMVPPELAGGQTPPPPPSSPGQVSSPSSDLTPANSPQTKDAIRSGAAKVSDDELLKFPPQDRDRAKSLAEMIYAEDVQRFNTEMDTYNEWKDVLGRGIKASADVAGEIRTLPLHLRNNKFQFGQTHDLIAEDALSRGLIQRPEDLFDAIKNIKKPVAPFHPDSNLSEARQIIDGEREADAGTSIEPTWDDTFEAGTEPSFFESRAKYGDQNVAPKKVKEQGDLFAAPKENLGQAYDRLIIQARKQGLSVPEAVKYAKRTLAAQGRGAEAPQGNQQAAQMEMGAPGGVEGFGRGQKGQSDLFSVSGKNKFSGMGMVEFQKAIRAENDVSVLARLSKEEGYKRNIFLSDELSERFSRERDAGNVPFGETIEQWVNRRATANEDYGQKGQGSLFENSGSYGEDTKTKRILGSSHLVWRGLSNVDGLALPSRNPVGIYATDSYDLANKYSNSSRGNALSAIDIEGLKIIDLNKEKPSWLHDRNGLSWINTPEDQEFYTNLLKTHGYDGAKFTESEEPTYFMVSDSVRGRTITRNADWFDSRAPFGPEHYPPISRSAIGNSGTFDPNNPSIVAESRQLEMGLNSEVPNEKQGNLPNAGRANPYGITNQAPMELQYKKEGTLTFAGKTISSPDDVAFAFKALKNQAVEHLYAVGTKNGELVSVELISIGSIDQALAPPYEIVGLLRDRGADGFWIVHNHPSGNPKPSPEDHKLFDLLYRGLRRVGLKFNGGVVIDDTRYSYVDPFSIGEHKEFVYPGMEGKKTADVDVLKKYVQWNGPKERPILVNEPNVVYDLVKGSQISKDSMSVLLLNTKNRLMGHATIPINAGVDAIVDLASKWRSPNAIISIQADNELPRGKFSDWPRQLGDLGIRLVDVVTVNDNSYSTWREKGTFPSVYVNESQAEYSVREKNGEQAVILPNGGYVPLATMSKFKRFMREWFTAERGVGKTIDRLNEERIGKIMETAFDAPLTGKALLSYLKKNPSEDLRQGIFDALTGKREIESLPEEIVPTVKKMRADVDALSRAVADGASPNDNMRMVIERNLGQYLGRYYKLFERKRFRPSPEVIARAKAKMRELNPKTLGKASEEEMDGIIENILSKGDVTFHRGDRRVDIPQNHFIKRKDIPKEIRELYGEITDPTWAYLKTMSDQAVIAHNATFLGQIANVEGAFKDKPTRTHFKLIPDTARWGSVRGKYTTPEINDFLIEAIDPVDSGLFRLVEKFVVNPFKWTKTVASLPSHPRNMLGNTMFSVLGSNAITNPMNAPYYWKALRIIMGREGKYRETWKELVRARVADTQYWGSEMPKLMSQMISDPTDWPNKILETAKWPIEKLGNLYNNEDLIYRVSSYLKYREKGMTVNQAAAEVDKWFTNYARLPKAVKVARRVGVFGPFFSFKANTARILTTAVREAADGIKKGNPAPALRLAFVLSFISALAALSKKLFDVDEDKMKKLQDIGPVYKRNSNPIYYRTSDSKIKAFDLGYIWPTGEFQKAAKAALTGDVQSFFDSIDLFQHPIFDAHSVLFNNYDTRARRGVSDPNDPLPMQAADKMANILSQIYVPASSPVPSLPALMKGRIEPGLFSGYQMKTIYDAYHGVQDRFGRTRKMPEELRAFATGIRTWEVNPDDIVKSYLFRKKGEMNEAKRDIMRRVSANNLTQQERNVAAQLRDSGINTDSEKAQDFMKARGVSDSDSRRRIIGVNVEIENFKRRQEKIARDVKDATELLKEINKGD